MSDLRGVTVLLTRSAEDNAPLAEALARRGATPLELPCVRTARLADASALASAIRALAAEDWLVVTSRAGADGVAGAVTPDETPARVAAIGASTTQRLVERGFRVAFMPAQPNGAALARDLPLGSGRVLLARADRATAELPDGLRARGARVEEVVAYRTLVGAFGDVAGVRRRCEAGRIDVIVFASPSAVDGLCDAIPRAALRRARSVAIGPATASRVRERIGAEPRLANDPTLEGIMRAVERCGREVVHVGQAAEHG